MTYTFQIPGVTPSQNQLDGKHWAYKHRQKKYWFEAVGYTARRCTFVPKKATVHIERVSKRLIDELNIPAGCKWLLDAFVEMGWLYDDSPDFCSVTTGQRKCLKGEEPHMGVTITY